jgi:hypothetical protein
LQKFLAVLVFFLCAPRAVAAAAPTIDLYTMGPGDDVFSRFGHAALCVDDPARPEVRCYNYGTADFDEPVSLSLHFLRGHARFYVDTTSLTAMLRSYRKADRAVYRQTLPLPPDDAASLKAALEHDALPEHREYVYHFFANNCATRLRDLIDKAVGGRLREAAKVPLGPSYRDLALLGFAQNPRTLGLAAELFLGRSADVRPTRFDAMFLPDVLRDEVESRLGVSPEVVLVRVGPLAEGDTYAARRLLWGVAIALAALAALLLRVAPRAARIALGLLLGLAGLVVDAFCAVTSGSDLARNELLLVFVVTDFSLVFLRGAWRRGYLLLRIGGLGAVSLLVALGILVQPLWAPLAVASAPLCWLWAYSSQEKSDTKTER